MRDATLISASRVLVVFLLVGTAFAADRDPKQRAAFMRENPCPLNGKSRGACPGYVVDHIKPLCDGGADRPSNMQWQAVDDAKQKDREEWRTCRDNRRSLRIIPPAPSP